MFIIICSDKHAAGDSSRKLDSMSPFTTNTYKTSYIEDDICDSYGYLCSGFFELRSLTMDGVALL